MAGLTGDQKTDSHPLTVMVVRLLKKGTAGGYEIPAAKAKTLQQDIAKTLNADNMVGSVAVIANLAFFLHEHKNSPDAARLLLEAAEAAVKIAEARGIDTREARAALDDIGKRFASFAGGRGPITAPKLGEAAPAGSIKAGAAVRGLRRV